MLKLPRRDLKYLLILVATLLIWAIAELFTTPPLDWTVTLDHRDRQPFGTLLLHEVVTDLFPEGEFEFNQRTIPQILRQGDPDNIIIIAHRLQLEENNLEALLNYLDSGGNVLLSANFMDRKFLDTLNLKLKDNLIFPSVDSKDSVGIQFHSKQEPGQVFYFDQHYFSTYFDSIPGTYVQVLASTLGEEPVLIDYPFGEGHLYLSSTPLVFSNYYLSQPGRPQLASNILSLLPFKSTTWTEYYQTGKMESTSPLRYILSQRPLQWAYFTGILLLLVFVILQAHRRQRIIPVVPPPSNATLDFVEVMTNIYLKKSNHSLIASQRLRYLQEHLKRVVGTAKGNQLDFTRKIKLEYGLTEAEARKLWQDFQSYPGQRNVSHQELLDLNNRINKIYRNG